MFMTNNNQTNGGTTTTDTTNNGNNNSLNGLTPNNQFLSSNSPQIQGTTAGNGTTQPTPTSSSMLMNPTNYHLQQTLAKQYSSSFSGSSGIGANGAMNIPAGSHSQKTASAFLNPSSFNNTFYPTPSSNISTLSSSRPIKQEDFGNISNGLNMAVMANLNSVNFDPLNNMQTDFDFAGLNDPINMMSPLPGSPLDISPEFDGMEDITSGVGGKFSHNGSTNFQGNPNGSGSLANSPYGTSPLILSQPVNIVGSAGAHRYSPDDLLYDATAAGAAAAFPQIHSYAGPGSTATANSARALHLNLNQKTSNAANSFAAPIPTTSAQGLNHANSHGLPITGGGSTATSNSNIYSMSMPVHGTGSNFANPAAAVAANNQLNRATDSPFFAPSSYGSYAGPGAFAAGGGGTPGTTNDLCLKSNSYDFLDELDSNSRQLEILNEKRRRRRESHNAVERRRRDNINEKIHELSTLIPENILNPPNSDGTITKPNKGIILKKSVEYIKHLQSQLLKQETRNKGLEKELEKIKKK